MENLSYRIEGMKGFFVEKQNLICKKNVLCYYMGVWHNIFCRRM